MTTTSTRPTPRTDTTDVVAPCGVVHGAREDVVHVFRGIPYAAAPVGDLRFAPPQPAPFVADLDATRFGPISVQDIDPLADVLPGTENAFHSRRPRLDEDCLSLNVWTSDPSGSAPVYVYVHGGSFLYGSGTGPWCDGAPLAREHGVVVVTLNYRLGLLGNLWLGDHDPSAADLGLQDVVAALRWVRENIGAFGGDPDTVTVGGESAGAMAVSALLVAPAAHGLFRRAVLQSGHLGLVQSVEAARHSTELILRDLHVDPAGDVLGQLRETTVLRLAAVQRRHGLSLGTVPLVADGVTLPTDPERALAAGAARGVDVLIGHMTEEDRLFHVVAGGPPATTVGELIASRLPGLDLQAQASALYERVQRDGGLSDEELHVAVAVDHSWREPVFTLASLHAGSGGRTHVFEFAWRSSVPGLGAAHLVDVPLFFDNLGQPGVADLLGDEVGHDPAVATFAGRVSGALARFVRTGDPSGPLGAWPAYTGDRPATMVIDLEPRVETALHAERFAFWAAHRDRSAAPLAAITGAAG
ncbi:carboxylesterase/lipase family protein [Jatrophihabitans sp. YIM 134969]